MVGSEKLMDFSCPKMLCKSGTIVCGYLNQSEVVGERTEHLGTPTIFFLIFLGGRDILFQQMKHGVGF